MGSGPNLNQILPDPILTNVATNVWGQGAFLADRIAPVKRVPKDRYKFAAWDKSVLQQTFEAMRSPGDRATRLPRPEKSYTEGLIKESALRSEYTQEDIDNAISPDEPRVTATIRITNALQYLVETVVHTKYLPANIASTNKTTASSVWSGASTKIQKDIEDARTVFVKRSGMYPNYIIMPIDVWPIFLTSTEIKGLRIYTESNLWQQAGSPPSVFGLTLLVPGMRYDSAPTGTYTPAFVWNDDAVWLGYSPALAGGMWNGNDPVFCGQFEANLAGDTPFAVREQLSPYFNEDKTYIVSADFRRTTETVNSELVYAITTVK